MRAVRPQLSLMQRRDTVDEGIYFDTSGCRLTGRIVVRFRDICTNARGAFVLPTLPMPA